MTKGRPPVEGTASVQLATCRSFGFRPADSFTLQWIIGNQQPQLSSGSAVLDTTTETYNYTNQNYSKVSRLDNGKTLTCPVNHRTLSASVSATETITVQCKFKSLKDIGFMNNVLIS